MEAILTPAREKLRTVFGFDDFRPGQDEVIHALLGGCDVLAIMPTGGGKSLCYQLPAILRHGLTIVVSPLIALMRDQVSQLQNFGVSAGSLNSANEAHENQRVLNMLESSKLDLLYLAPERLVREETRELLTKSCVSLLAVDEAHCVSQWGHDFRPEYLEIGKLRQSLGNVQTIALTATADEATRQDMITRLFPHSPETFVLGFDRPNLYLSMQPKAKAKQQLLNVINRHHGESGIVYCLSRKKTETLTNQLVDQGIPAVCYHAGMEKSERSRNQDRFLKEDGVIVVATIAFGMGIDKPDVRFVCHADLPKNIESYYQEIGRAGRDGLPAETLTLYGLDDMRLRRLQIEEGDASDEQKRVERQRFTALIALCEAPRCRRQTLLAYFGEQCKPCGNCDLCVNEIEIMDGTVEAQKAMSAIMRTGQRFGTEHLVNILLGESTDKIKQFSHDRLPTFGAGGGQSRNIWRAVFRQLYASGHIAMDIVNYGRWTLTDSGAEILRGGAEFKMRKDVVAATTRDETRSSKKPAALNADLIADEQALYEELKLWRLQLARRENVPAYVVFADRTLIEMAQRRPSNNYELAEVHGVGAVKLEKYAGEVLGVIEDFYNRNR